MDSNEEISEETVDSKYIIKEKKGGGGTSKVFLVMERKSKLHYIAKILIDEEGDKDGCFESEVKYLTLLKEQKNSFIINIIDKGKGHIIRKNHPDYLRNYIILEYAPKRKLLDYIKLTKKGFGELYSKIIFSKILKGIQSLHKQTICHRDIKMENILLDNNFFPRIADFGFAASNEQKFTKYIGTKHYAAPEILAHEPYDGIKADIFSLGAVLIYLTIGKIGFEQASYLCGYYSLIQSNKLKDYWELIEPFLNEELSPEFKDLYIKMVNFEPTKRPNLEEILAHSWFKTEVDMNLLEKEVKEEFQIREELINIILTPEVEMSNNDTISKGSIRSFNNQELYFQSELKPKQAPNGLNMSFCIKIKGKVNPTKFMNFLCNLMIREYGVDYLYINPDTEKSKFIANFEEGEDEENKEKIKRHNIIIKIKLYKHEDELILKFVKKEGNKEDFYDVFINIPKLIKKYL